MTRPDRVNVEGAVYHVYNRVSRGEAVFDDADLASRFVALLRRVKDRDQISVFAWVLMSNHFHLVVRTGPIALDRPLRSLQQMITRAHNARNGVFGPLWQGRYRAKMVTDQVGLDRLIAYVHLNPVAAGIVADPGEHPWSGHLDLIGRTRQPIVDVDEVLHTLGATRKEARARYVRTLRATEEAEWVKEQPGRLPWWRLGRPPKAEGEAPEPDRKKAHVDVLGRSTGLERPRVEAGDFLTRGARHLGVSLDDLRSRQRAPDIVRARTLLAAVGVERHRLQVKEMAAALNKSPDGISRCVSRGSRFRGEDADFRRSYEDLDHALAAGSKAESRDETS